MQRVESFLQTAELIQCVDLMEFFFFKWDISISLHTRDNNPQSIIQKTPNVYILRHCKSSKTLRHKQNPEGPVYLDWVEFHCQRGLACNCKYNWPRRGP